MPDAPGAAELLAGHGTFASPPAQYASAAQGAHALGLVFSKPALHVQSASAEAPTGPNMSAGHCVHGAMLRAVLYAPAAQATQKLWLYPPCV